MPCRASLVNQTPRQTIKHSSFQPFTARKAPSEDEQTPANPFAGAAVQLTTYEDG